MKNRFSKHCLRLMMISLILNTICLSNLYSDNSYKVLPIDEGNWMDNDNQRSIDSNCFMGYINGDIIELHNKSSNYDLYISVINQLTGEVCYEIAIPKESSNYIILPINNLYVGEYKLIISNSIAGYAFAFFSI